MYTIILQIVQYTLDIISKGIILRKQSISSLFNMHSYKDEHLIVCVI